VKRAERAKHTQTSELQLFIGHQWGETPSGENHFLVNRIGDELEITAVMPRYLSETRSCDLLRQYEIARRNRSIGKQRTGKDSPHIRFANAKDDDQLIEFVRSFGPVVAAKCKVRTSESQNDLRESASEPHAEMFITARQSLPELKKEQRIYRAALNLLMELAKKPAEYDSSKAGEWIVEIALEIQDWPRQWTREQREQGKSPLWRPRKDSIQRITALVKVRRDLLLVPQVDARIVICALVNMFPPLAFPNAFEMHAHIRFGIRPLLYSILRREFLYPHEVGICENTRCRDFFEIERSGQRFCGEECSRQHRQRDYWQRHGKKVRKKRLADKARRQDIKNVRRRSQRQTR
jgi:hypothetical protein